MQTEFINRGRTRYFVVYPFGRGGLEPTVWVEQQKTFWSNRWKQPLIQWSLRRTRTPEGTKLFIQALEKAQRVACMWEAEEQLDRLLREA